MTNKITSKTCPLCSSKVSITNASFIKIEGQRVCSRCASKLNAVYPGRLSFKNMSISETKKSLNQTFYFSNGKACLQPKSTSTPIKLKVPKEACCPKCHSQNIIPMGHKHKNISIGKAAGGAILFGYIGLAAGFLGKTEKKVEFYCSDCGKIFKR